MKHIKKFEQTENDSRLDKLGYYDSQTFSEHDDNIDDIFLNINLLKKENIKFFIYKFIHNNSIIYFKIFAFPKNEEEIKSVLKCNKFSNTLMQRSIEDVENQLSKFAEKLNDNITKEDIDLIYQIQKYNL